MEAAMSLTSNSGKRPSNPNVTSSGVGQTNMLRALGDSVFIDIAQETPINKNMQHQQRQNYPYYPQNQYPQQQHYNQQPQYYDNQNYHAPPQKPQQQQQSSSRRNSLASTSSSHNFFKRGKARFKQGKSDYGGDGFDDGDGDIFGAGGSSELPHDQDINVSFDDLQHIRGEDRYGNGIQKGNAPNRIDAFTYIPTLSTKPTGSNGSVNNTQYRKQMTAQKKLMATHYAKNMANQSLGPPGLPGPPRTMSLQSAPQGPMPPRAMSLQTGPGYPRTMSMQGPSPQQFAGAPKRNPNPTRDPRAMSMQSPCMGGGPPAGPQYQDPRTMSLQSIDAGPQYQDPRAMSMQSMNGGYNYNRAQQHPGIPSQPPYIQRGEPRAMSLQSQRAGFQPQPPQPQQQVRRQGIPYPPIVPDSPAAHPSGTRYSPPYSSQGRVYQQRANNNAPQGHPYQQQLRPPNMNQPQNTSGSSSSLNQVTGAPKQYVPNQQPQQQQAQKPNNIQPMTNNANSVDSTAIIHREETEEEIQGAFKPVQKSVKGNLSKFTFTSSDDDEDDNEAEFVEEVPNDEPTSQPEHPLPVWPPQEESAQSSPAQAESPTPREEEVQPIIPESAREVEPLLKSNTSPLKRSSLDSEVIRQHRVSSSSYSVIPNSNHSRQTGKKSISSMYSITSSTDGNNSNTEQIKNIYPSSSGRNNDVFVTATELPLDEQDEYSFSKPTSNMIGDNTSKETLHDNDTVEEPIDNPLTSYEDSKTKMKSPTDSSFNNSITEDLSFNSAVEYQGESNLNNNLFSEPKSSFRDESYDDTNSYNSIAKTPDHTVIQLDDTAVSESNLSNAIFEKSDDGLDFNEYPSQSNEGQPNEEEPSKVNQQPLYKSMLSPVENKKLEEDIDNDHDHDNSIISKQSYDSGSNRLIRKPPPPPKDSAPAPVPVTQSSKKSPFAGFREAFNRPIKSSTATSSASSSAPTTFNGSSPNTSTTSVKSSLQSPNLKMNSRNFLKKISFKTKGSKEDGHQQVEISNDPLPSQQQQSAGAGVRYHQQPMTIDIPGLNEPDTNFSSILNKELPKTPLTPSDTLMNYRLTLNMPNDDSPEISNKMFVDMNYSPIEESTKMNSNLNGTVRKTEVAPNNASSELLNSLKIDELSSNDMFKDELTKEYPSKKDDDLTKRLAVFSEKEPYVERQKVSLLSDGDGYDEILLKKLSIRDISFNGDRNELDYKGVVVNDSAAKKPAELPVLQTPVRQPVVEKAVESPEKMKQFEDLFTPDQLYMLNCNQELLNELQIVSNELANSVSREIKLENKLESNKMVEYNMIKETENILDLSELAKQLIEEKRKRHVVEELLIKQSNNLINAEHLKEIAFKNSNLTNELFELNESNQLLKSNLVSIQDENDEIKLKLNDVMNENKDLTNKIIPMLKNKIEILENSKNSPCSSSSSSSSPTSENTIGFNSNNDRNTKTDSLRYENQNLKSELDLNKDELNDCKSQIESLRDALKNLKIEKNLEIKLMNEKNSSLEKRLLKSFGANGGLSPTRGASTDLRSNTSFDLLKARKVVN